MTLSSYPELPIESPAEKAEWEKPILEQIVLESTESGGVNVPESNDGMLS